MNKEIILKPVIDYEDYYSVSSCGKVYSNRSKKFLKQCKVNGYLSVQLNVKGVAKNKYVHRLVAEAFLDNPDKLPEVDHSDSNKKNNHVENLSWITKKDNVEAANANFYTLISPEGEQVFVYNLSEFCRDNNLDPSCMHKVLNGTRKHCKGWKVD